MKDLTVQFSTPNKIGVQYIYIYSHMFIHQCLCVRVHVCMHIYILAVQSPSYV